MRSSDGYQPHIDGLRAVAVLSVVLFHSSAPGFAGGYAGVDVFFVISGYLIGGQIAEEIARGGFSLVSFYERRIRRIFPALFCVLALVLAASSLILFEPDFRQLVPIAAASVVFLANVRIWATLGDYSGGFAQGSPLLHTWSLAVEEQFYLVFPLLMLVAARFGRRRYFVLLAPLALASLVACVWAARAEPLEDFYLAPFRAWEFLLGALASTAAPPAPRWVWARNGMASLGLVLIAASDVLFGPDTPFPSEYALGPCLGATLVVYSNCEPSSIAGRILGNPVARWIGLWSYSLYLIHWPLLVLTRYYFDDRLSPAAQAAVLAASLGLAALSWRFVERPFRGRGRLFTTRQLYATAGAATAVLLGVILIAPRVYPSSPRAFPSLSSAQLACWDLTPDVATRFGRCTVGAPAPPRAVLWGDSHARALTPGAAFAFAAHHESAVVFAQGGCPPLLKVEFGRPRPSFGFFGFTTPPDPPAPRCAPHNDAVLRWLAAHKMSAVILAAHWIAYADTAKTPSAAADHLTLMDAMRPQTSDSAAIFERQLTATVRALQTLGIRVFLVEDAPQQQFNVPVTLAAEARLARPVPRGLSRAAYDAQQHVATTIFERLRSRYGVILLRPQDVLCNGRGGCVITRDGEVLYQDDEHLSPPGAIAVASAFAPLWPTTPAPSTSSRATAARTGAIRTE